MPLVTGMTKIRDCIRSLELTVSDYLDHEDFSIVKIEDLGFQLPFHSHTFRPDFFSIAIIDSAECYFEVGNESYYLTSNWVLFTQPDVFVSCRFLSLERAYYITFSADFLREYGYMSINKFAICSNAVAFDLNSQMMGKIKETCSNLYAEATSNSLFKYDIIGNLLSGLLLELQKMEENKIGGLTALITNRETEMVNGFFLNLEKNISELFLGKTDRVNRISDYAMLQHVQCNYLSSMVYRNTGKTASFWIHQKLIDDIMYLLKCSNKSIKEISFMYGFYEVANFSSYFRKHTGISPNRFRQVCRIYHLNT